MIEFVIATNNKKKLEEMSRIMLPLNIDVVTAKDIGIDLGDVEEHGTTFSENAYIKAKSAFDLLGGKYCVVADDSGLCVDALDGQPGIYSARFGGEGLTDTQRVQLLLDKLTNVEKNARTAYFACSICAIMTDCSVITTEGICCGYIGESPIGDGGFGYDPVFMVGEKSFSQLSDEEKDDCSHRGIALREFRHKIQNYLEVQNVNK